ncbi:MAG: helix-hairpin-helix domain-containing protein [Saprospiraceae bacterium]|jgi:DNA uptake protein ComE-like DNA-binding protein|nr:helix-hairpin-helix domain-containing protein [Saprospiraceae bacterium]MBP7800231.1 helix-hairpin-helix domain-containing protein [Saprospiraceae bacterium]MBP7923505.1 helix-hairpin-helix domain-containing protein [Saprospiraceae bacterium]MBP8096161.1 helix-hairpin-helix domain-containing protein [Saprospiraceae bacterium]MBP8944235.1 helix-hairpin-helix domain-containing protein [Saprospiraceae bacterium]
MKEYPKNKFFIHTFKERKSILYLFLTLVFLSAAYLYIFNRPVTSNIDIKPLEVPDSNTLKEVQKLNPSNHVFSPTFKNFDPNHVSQAELTSMGVPPKAASNWVKYLAKAGKFRNPSDLSKIFGLSSETIERLKPYLSFEKPPEKKIVPEIIIQPQPVDPNVASLSELTQIGLPAPVAAHLVNYRMKGGKFYAPSDLAKIFGITDSILQVVASLVQYPSRPESPGVNFSIPIDLNLADTTLLKNLPGLGGVLSSRIVRFRDKLGGFHSLQQLKEVYHLPDSTIEKISPNLILATPVKKININSDSIHLLKHPYLSYKDALIVKNYRAQHGAFKGSDDLKSILAFDAAFWDRLLPYLEFTPP